MKKQKHKNLEKLYINISLASAYTHCHCHNPQKYFLIYTVEHTEINNVKFKI